MEGANSHVPYQEFRVFAFIADTCIPLQEQRRNRGYGRALLESIEEIARFLQIPRLLLCSTDDNDTKVKGGIRATAPSILSVLTPLPLSPLPPSKFCFRSS